MAFRSRRSTRADLRILPPFLAVLVFVNVIAPFVLPTPDVYFDFALAAVAAPLMVSNVLFLSRQGLSISRPTRSRCSIHGRCPSKSSSISSPPR